MQKKVILFLALFLTTAATTFFLMKPNPKKEAQKAFLHFKSHKYVAADASLKALNALTNPYKTIYRGYLEQARGRFEASDYILQGALQEARQRNDCELAAEIWLAKATNAYMTRRDADINVCIEEAQYYNPTHPALSFFEGLQCYLKQDYAGTLRLWAQNNPDEMHQWLALALENYFPFSWKRVHTAHCLIENGEIARAREILESEGHHAVQEEFQHLAHFFLALSYLKESRTLPFDQRTSFYNMARFYFEQAPVNERFWREKQTIVAHVEEEAKTLLLASYNEPCRKCAFDFVRILQEWWATGSINRLTHQLAEKMAQEYAIEQPLLFCNAANKAFLGTPFHTQLTEKMLGWLAQSLREGKHEKLFDQWAIVETLSPNPMAAVKEIATLSSEDIFETIKKDDLRLTGTRRSIAFWEKLDRSQADRETLAYSLLSNSKLFWHNEMQEKKGLRLMEMALNLSNRSYLIQKEIASFLTTLYAQAEGNNMVRRLTLIYEAMERFDLGRQEPASLATIANHLADAEYLYAVRNFPAATTHASWVLKLDPQNDGARRLVGLCTFHLGEYSRALAHLKEVKSLDDEALKAMMLSQALTAQDLEPHLCHTEDSSFDDAD